jgi:type I restriction enzyme R subunit
LAEKLQERRLSNMPDAFAGHRHAQAFEIDTVVDASVAEHSINPQNIEAGIRKQLLPRMFQECKAIGCGMEQAKKIVEMVVQITRVGLSGV